MFVYTPAWRLDARCFVGKFSQPIISLPFLQNQFRTNKQTKGKQFNEPFVSNWYIENMS